MPFTYTQDKFHVGVWSAVGREAEGRKESWSGGRGRCAGRGVRGGWGVRGGMMVCGHEMVSGERWVRMSLVSSGSLVIRSILAEYVQFNVGSLAIGTCGPQPSDPHTYIA